MKKTLAFVLTVVVLTVTAIFCAMTTEAKVQTGTTGDCTWTLDGTVLTISGNGAMGDNSSPWGTSITEVIIEDGVTRIGNRAFERCTQLESVRIPASLSSIGESAFGSMSLKSVHITDLVQWCGIDFYYFYVMHGGYSSNPLSNGANLYLNGELVTDLVFPDSVTSVGAFAFHGCNSIKSITFHDGKKLVRVRSIIARILPM